MWYNPCHVNPSVMLTCERQLSLVKTWMNRGANSLDQKLKLRVYNVQCKNTNRERGLGGGTFWAYSSGEKLGPDWLENYLRAIFNTLPVLSLSDYGRRCIDKWTGVLCPPKPNHGNVIFFLFDFCSDLTTTGLPLNPFSFGIQFSGDNHQKGKFTYVIFGHFLT